MFIWREFLIITESSSAYSLRLTICFSTGRKDDFLLAKKYEIHLCRLVFTGVHHSNKIRSLRVAITTKTLRFSFR